MVYQGGGLYIMMVRNLGGGSNLITFTVDGTEYQAEEGMTWGDFIGSKYNNDRKFSVVSNIVFYNNRQLTVSGGYLLYDSSIHNGVVYYTTSGGAD